MIKVVDVYYDCKMEVNTGSNGSLGIKLFNALSKRAELKIIDFVTGDISAMSPPEPYLSQKNRDWLANLTASKALPVSNGRIKFPADYYRYENQYVVSAKYSEEINEDDCQEVIEKVKREKRTIALLGLDEFSVRMETYIESLIPSHERPISKMMDGGIEYEPVDVGNVVLEYIRQPKFAKIVSMTDQKYNTEVPDLAKSIDYEWHIGLYNLIVWVIVDLFYNRTSQRSGKEMNILSKDLRK